jgi:exosortase/archaeosortase family protein
MKKDGYFKELVLRVIASFAVLMGYPLFSLILTPITLHISYFFFNIFVPSAIVGAKIVTVMDSFELIPACVATSAYLLLAILILLTKGISLSERFQMFVYGSLAILAFNILRIELLLLAYFRLETAFDTIHLFVWKFMSTAFVVLLWLGLARLYKVKTIPVYSDLRHIMGMIKPPRKK